MLSLTPMMKQYREIKKQNPDTILFFRMGDFYEMFEEDAITASKILGLTLTSRNHGGTDKTPLCGFPHHAVDRYISKIINHGKKVAVCEQTEDPKKSKGIVKRDVIEVITKGTATNADMLNEKANNFVVCFLNDNNLSGFAGADVSTGEFFVSELPLKKLLNEMDKLNPSEIICSFSAKNSDIFRELKSDLPQTSFSFIEEWNFSYSTSYNDLIRHFKTTTLDGFGVEGLNLGIICAGVLLNYIKEQKRNKIGHIKKISLYNTNMFMALDNASIRNLELIYPIHKDDKNATLFSVLDNTKTAMGARLLRRYIVNPLLKPKEIEKRLDCVDYFFKNEFHTDKLRNILSGICDIERINGKIGYEKINPRDLYILKNSLYLLKDIINLFESSGINLISNSLKDLHNTETITDKLEKAIQEEPPISISDGNIFNKGYNKDLDTIIDGSKDGKEWIANLQTKERQKTGISNLKVGFNKVFGYYIEVSKSNINKIPEGYIRKQTLVNGERFITEQLKKWESIVLNAEEKQKELERNLFEDLRKWMSQYIDKLKSISDAIAFIDVMSTFSINAKKNNYTRPKIDDSDTIFIEEGRHPVIEKMDITENFIANDLNIKGNDKFIHIITGPNMAGKSTYLRQNGLIVLMAQIGSFVPAKSASIGVVDRIFTRVGASDRLARGQSTFLVEMQELANILNNASNKSLVLLDEIGRGTSTFDGLSIAWALVEYIHNNKRCSAKTLFATHYHELAELPLILGGVKNYNVSVKEWNDEIIFLRKIVEGACDHSYGIQVARLAGVPESVIKRAKEVLNNLESGELTPDNKPVISRSKEKKNEEIKNEKQLSIFEELENNIIDYLNNTDINNITPLEALNKLSKLKKMTDNK